ncbi:MAG: hypothetical protein ABI361_08110 [Nitrososphaera sp.]|jgi:hypothetical protein
MQSEGSGPASSMKRPESGQAASRVDKRNVKARKMDAAKDSCMPWNALHSISLNTAGKSAQQTKAVETAMRRWKTEGEECDLEAPVILNGCAFVICESCQWTATVSRTNEGRLLLDECPLCKADSFLSFIPLAKSESYRFTIDQTRGLDVQFRTIF